MKMTVGSSRGRWRSMLARSITLSLSHLATTMGLKAASLGRMRRWASRTANRGILGGRSEEHTSELQSLMRISYAVFCLKKKKNHHNITPNTIKIYSHDTQIDNKITQLK